MATRLMSTKTTFGDHMQDWGRPQDSQKFASCDFRGLPNLVNTNRGLRIPLKDLVLRITGLDGTIYWGREGLLKAWGELYLEKPEKMAVLGAIDNAPSMAEGLQLIVLVDSSGRVYFYESEVLHLVAESVKDFFTVGAKSPPIRSYKYGQHCAPKSEEEYLQIMKRAGIPQMTTSTRDFVKSREKNLKANLDFLESL
ncbi:hypothetical protein AGOR_G00226130 [Albula goreensis]|uniref:Uncharacterized protein n=1 Tax=Albula goreensis TaxID=1534307 RepID=A0A8T3CKE2_9TELE|nr:hypothetical protein AGOR_G00226130 [Albula goreensis]